MYACIQQQQHLFLRLYSRTYAHACVHVSSLGVSFHMVCAICAASAPHCRTACMPGAPPPPLLQLHAGSSSPVTRSQDRSRGCAATMPCYLHARTLRAQHAARSIARLAVARSQPPGPAGPPQSTQACRCSMPGRPGCSCMRLRLLERPGERTKTHGSVTRPCRSRASL